MKKRGEEMRGRDSAGSSADPQSASYQHAGFRGMSRMSETTFNRKKSARGPKANH